MEGVERMSTNSVYIPIKDLPKVLPYAIPWLEATINHFQWVDWSLQGVIQGLQTGRFHLWAAEKLGTDKRLWVLTQILDDLMGKSVNIVLGGGQLDDENELVEEIARIETWARSIGAKSIVVWGRMGWKKLLAPHGYRFETALFRRVFNDRMN